MTANISNQMPYLRTTRQFPQETQQLTLELEKAYLDIANVVNNRIIGMFPTNRPAVGGESWFITGNLRQQNLRQVYKFSDSNLIINHGLNLSSITNFTRIWGTFFDGTYWQTLPYVDVIASNNQINIKISSSQIIVTKGGGSPPAISNGLIILEWISNP